ncbi:MAG: hypothetical protein RR232_05970 [Clostridia bacterium]
MKLFSIYAIIAALTFGLFGCSAASQDAASEFDVECISSSAGGVQSFEPQTAVINSDEALKEYVRDMGEADREALMDAAGRLKDLFTDGRNLIILAFAVDSGSTDMKVSGVKCEGGEVAVELTRKTPEVGTMDMAFWTILIATQVPADATVKVNITDAGI